MASQKQRSLENNKWIHAFYDFKKKQAVIIISDNQELYNAKKFKNYKWLGCCGGNELRLDVAPKLYIKMN